MKKNVYNFLLLSSNEFLLGNAVIMIRFRILGSDAAKAKSLFLVALWEWYNGVFEGAKSVTKNIAKPNL